MGSCRFKSRAAHATVNRLHKKYAKPQKFAQSSIRVHSMAEIRSGIGVFGSFRQLTGIGTVIALVVGEEDAMKPKPSPSNFDSLFPVAIHQEPAQEMPPESPPRTISTLGELGVAASVLGIVVVAFMAVGFGSTSETKVSAKSGGKSKKHIETKNPPSTIASGASSAEGKKSDSSFSKGANATEQPPPPGVTKFVAIAQTAACHVSTHEVAKYLQRGEVAMTSEQGMFSVAWLVKLSPLRSEALLTFAGFSPDGSNMASPRSIGNSFETSPRLFGGTSDATLFWFDEQGLAFTNPMRQSTREANIDHIPGIGLEDAENIALAETPSGSVAGVTVLGWDPTQLGLFRLAPRKTAAPVIEAIGATHQGKKPQWPAIVSDTRGHTLAWHEDRGRIVVSRFNLEGREIHDAKTIAAEGVARGRVHLVGTPKGAIALWTEGERLVSRALDADGNPREETFVVGHGKNLALMSFRDGAIALFLGNDGETSNQSLAVRLGARGEPSSKGIRVSDGAAVEDRTAVARTGSNVAFLWTEASGNGSNTKSAQLRIIDGACIP